jgi:uncharacterized protein (DUF1501 family)
MAACGCPEFSRAQLIRRTVAEAGRGLPPVEPGMPTPAGTGLSRRSFLVRSGIGLLSVYGGSKLGLDQLRAGVAEAAAGKSPALISIFLEGGLDSLSVLAPVADPLYQRLRPTLALGSSGPPCADDPSLRWNPSAQPFDTLHREGKLALFPGVGYADPDQSHFSSRHYWEVGALDPSGRTGWLGRLLDRVGTADNPLQGLSLDGWLSPTLASASVPVAAVDGAQYELNVPTLWGEIEEQTIAAAASIGRAQTTDPTRAQVGAVAQQAVLLRNELAGFDDAVPATSSYPATDFGRNLATLATMLKSGMPIRCASLSATGSYDTHSAQRSTFDADLAGSAQAVLAFQRQLESDGTADRVVTLVWSEFGRRPEENGSAGTDHGAAGLAMVLGTRVRGGILTEPASLTNLDPDGNLRETSDYRSLYCSLLEQWFDVDAGSVIGDADTYPRHQLIRS